MLQRSEPLHLRYLQPTECLLIVCLIHDSSPWRLILLMGIFLRLPPALFQKPTGPLRSLVALHPQPASQQLGFDEGLYRDYATKLIRFGLISYPEIVERYREKQQTLTGSILPPVRFLYIFSAYLWHQLFGSETLSCLKTSPPFSAC